MTLTDPVVTAPQPHRAWEEVEAGTDLPSLRTEIPFKRVILNAAVTWDYFPGHHDPTYAREQGQDAIYVNTMFLQGLADRYVQEWAGNGAFVLARRLRMRRSIFAGDVAMLSGRVRDKARHGRLGLADLAVAIGTGTADACALVDATVWLPDPGQRYVDVAEDLAALAAARA